MPISNYTEVEADPRIVALAEQVARNLIARHAQASHLTDGFKRRPNNAHDALAARVAGMVGRE